MGINRRGEPGGGVAVDSSVQTITVEMTAPIATDNVAGESLTVTIPAGAAVLIDHRARLIGGTGVFGSPSLGAYLDVGETEFAPVSPQFLLGEGLYAGWQAIMGSLTQETKIYLYVSDGSFQNGGADTVQYAFDIRVRGLA